MQQPCEVGWVFFTMYVGMEAERDRINLDLSRVALLFLDIFCLEVSSLTCHFAFSKDLSDSQSETVKERQVS